MKTKYPNLQKYKLNVKNKSKDNKFIKKTQPSYYQQQKQKDQYPPPSNTTLHSFPPSLSISQFHILKQLGRGQNGKIYSAIHLPTGLIYALKYFQQQKLNIEYLIDQMKIQLFCQHQNILKAYGYIIEKVKIPKTCINSSKQEKQNHKSHQHQQQTINNNHEYYYNIFLIMQKGDQNLFSLIKNNKFLTQQQTITYTQQILSGLSYLHHNKIIHRDIKPQNIIVINNICKITDFGWSVIGSPQRETFCGTLQYMSPEVALGAKYDKKIDVWSIGILIYQMLTGEAPYDTQNILNNPCEQFRKRIFKKLPSQLSKEGKYFLEKLLEVNPRYRITLEQAMKDTWIADNKIRKTVKKKNMGLIRRYQEY